MKALLFGVSGQDGSYLAEHLLACDYHVVGVVRRPTADPFPRLAAILSHERFRLVEGDVTDAPFVRDCIAVERPDDVYNLAAQSAIPISWSQPQRTMETNAGGALNVLDGVRQARRPGYEPVVVQNTSADIFAPSIRACDLYSALDPANPYAVAKMTAHALVKLYRERYGLHAVSAVCFSHESPRRSPAFITRKITRGVARAMQGGAILRVGNLSAQRDWHCAIDTVRGLRAAADYARATPRDFIFASGILRTVQQIAEVAFNAVGLDWREHVKEDPALRRTHDKANVGSIEDTLARLKWTAKLPFEKWITDMVEADLAEHAEVGWGM